MAKSGIYCIPYPKNFHLKKLLAILLICTLYTPDAARLVLYAQCTLQANNGQQCDCNFSNIPADQQASSPKKQKEMQEQTDWKYLINEKPGYIVFLSENRKRYSGSYNQAYSFRFISAVFHPPSPCRSIL